MNKKFAIILWGIISAFIMYDVIKMNPSDDILIIIIKVLSILSWVKLNVIIFTKAVSK